MDCKIERKKRLKLSQMKTFACENAKKSHSVLERALSNSEESC